MRPTVCQECTADPPDTAASGQRCQILQQGFFACRFRIRVQQRPYSASADFFFDAAADSSDLGFTHAAAASRALGCLDGMDWMPRMLRCVVVQPQYNKRTIECDSSIHPSPFDRPDQKPQASFIAYASTLRRLRTTHDCIIASHPQRTRCVHYYYVCSCFFWKKTLGLSFKGSGEGTYLSSTIVPSPSAVALMLNPIIAQIAKERRMAAASSRLESLVGPKQDTLNQAWKEGGSSCLIACA